MAKIITITNPITGQPTQVDQLDHTAQEVDDGIYRALGYGLGGNATAVSDFNAATVCGWYRGGGSTVNGPDFRYSNYGVVHVIQNGGVIYQHYYMYSATGAIIPLTMAVRASDNYGTDWTPWEYINPPMAAGVEYRTVERFLGKPVYKVLINFGALPNTGSAAVNGTWTNADTVIDVKGLIKNADGSKTTFPVFEDAQIYARFWTRPAGQIVVKTYTDLSAATAQFVVSYIKG